MDLDPVSVHKHAKKELGQYPAILISGLVNDPYAKFNIHVGVLVKSFLFGMHISVQKEQSRWVPCDIGYKVSRNKEITQTSMIGVRREYDDERKTIRC